MSHSKDSHDRRPTSRVKLFVGDIGENRKTELMKLFEKYGDIASLYVDENKRFAFVEFKLAEHATEALRRADGKTLNGAKLRVEFARHDNKRDDGRPRNLGNGSMSGKHIIVGNHKRIGKSYGHRVRSLTPPSVRRGRVQRPRPNREAIPPRDAYPPYNFSYDYPYADYYQPPPMPDRYFNYPSNVPSRSYRPPPIEMRIGGDRRVPPLPPAPRYDDRRLIPPPLRRDSIPSRDYPPGHHRNGMQHERFRSRSPMYRYREVIPAEYRRIARGGERSPHHSPMRDMIPAAAVYNSRLLSPVRKYVDSSMLSKKKYRERPISRSSRSRSESYEEEEEEDDDDDAESFTTMSSSSSSSKRDSSLERKKKKKSSAKHKESKGKSHESSHKKSKKKKSKKY